MKKILFSIMSAGFLMMNPQTANAQFFKKILKAAGDVLNEAVSTAPGAQSQFGGVQGISVEWGECVRWGDNVNVKFALVNNSRNDIPMAFHNTWPSGEKHSFAIAENGDRYGIDFISLGGTINDNCSVTVPAGIKVQCIARINKAGGKVSKFKYVSVGGWNAGQQSPNYSYISPALTVTEVSNTNRDNLKCTLPSVTVNEKSVTRVGNDVQIAFNLIQNSGKDMKISLGEIKAYDADGNAYTAIIQPNATAEMISGIPVNKTLVIKDVPTTTTLSIIRITIADRYQIEWRNVAIPQ